jgi:hypothetical protein
MAIAIVHRLGNLQLPEVRFQGRRGSLRFMEHLGALKLRLAQLEAENRVLKERLEVEKARLSIRVNPVKRKQTGAKPKGRRK